jgi:hypothetical protein
MYLFIINTIILGIGAHTCNLSYSGHRDQKDQGSKPA